MCGALIGVDRPVAVEDGGFVVSVQQGQGGDGDGHGAADAVPEPGRPDALQEEVAVGVGAFGVAADQRLSTRAVRLRLAGAVDAEFRGRHSLEPVAADRFGSAQAPAEAAVVDATQGSIDGGKGRGQFGKHPRPQRPLVGQGGSLGVVLVVGIPAAASIPHGVQGVTLPAQLLLEVVAFSSQQRVEVGDNTRTQRRQRLGHGHDTDTVISCEPPVAGQSQRHCRQVSTEMAAVCREVTELLRKREIFGNDFADRSIFF